MHSINSFIFQADQTTDDLFTAGVDRSLVAFILPPKTEDLFLLKECVDNH